MGNKQNPKPLDVFLFSIVDYIYTQSFETWGAVVQEKRRDKDFNRGVFHQAERFRVRVRVRVRVYSPEAFVAGCTLGWSYTNLIVHFKIYLEMCAFCSCSTWLGRSMR